MEHKLAHWLVAQVDNECLGLEYFGKYVVKLLAYIAVVETAYL